MPAVGHRPVLSGHLRPSRLLVTSAALVGILGGCGPGHDAAVPASSGSAAPPATVGRAGTTPAPTSPAPGPTAGATVAPTVPATVPPAPTASDPAPQQQGPLAAGAPPACGADDLRAAVEVQPPTGPQPEDRTRALLVVTSEATSACTLDGFAALVGAGRAGGAVALPTVDVDQPAPPQSITLERGDSAFAGLEWTTAAGCPTVVAVGVVPPAQGSAAPATVVDPGGAATVDPVCAGSVDVGPLEATAPGDTAFPDSVGAGLASCTPADLAGRVSPPDGHRGVGRLTLTDTARVACVVGADLDVALLDSAGAVLPTAVERAVPPGTVAIEPGATVTATVGLPAAGGSATRCGPLATATRIELAGAALRVAGPGVAVCAGPVLLGPLTAAA